MDKKRTEFPPRKCFRWGSVDHLIAKCLKSPKDTDRQQKTSVSMKGLIVHRKKKTEDSDDENDQNMYASMARMSGN